MRWLPRKANQLPKFSKKVHPHNVHEIMFAHPTLDEILVNALTAKRVKVQA